MIIKGSTRAALSRKYVAPPEQPASARARAPRSPEPGGTSVTTHVSTHPDEGPYGYPDTITGWVYEGAPDVSLILAGADAPSHEAAIRRPTGEFVAV